MVVKYRECQDFGNVRAYSCKSCPHYPNCSNYRYRVSERYYEYKELNKNTIKESLDRWL